MHGQVTASALQVLEPVGQFSLGLRLNVRSDVALDREERSCQGSHIICITAWKEVGDEIDGHDQISKSSPDDQLLVVGCGGCCGCVIKHQRQIHQLFTYRAGNFADLLPKTLVVEVLRILLQLVGVWILCAVGVGT